MRRATARFAVPLLGLALILPIMVGCSSGEVKQTPEEVQAMMHKNGQKKMGPAAGGPGAPGTTSKGAE